ncbi:hypothetical protein ASD28_11420 [Massilia sp. Root133]|uniref:hypothetical protein n=1 Tax=unclassified Massilia TaxID=2609279 RepID=UPI0006FE4707|nr:MULTISPECIES: hypothetical protein [unclassified Massilia]KQY00982.1 hypothetical protein ASD28_11420 [Massilia sp. Root133]KQZ52988.1 hypothetical protein ASD92_13200 [Massilia sp. Root1485]
MRNSLARQTAAALAFLAVAGNAMLAPIPAQAAGHYKHFKTAIYIPVNVTQSLVDPQVFEHQFARAMSQVPFDKVYIEGYRDNHFASDAEIEAVKRQFQAKGIEVAGGVTLAAGGFNGQFMTFDYESSRDRDTCKRAMALMARHFDHVILDDFTFYTSKSDADIKAKGKRTWTDYRLATMRKVSKDLIIDPARAVNKNVKIVIKYPNWYEHFEGLGFDLAQQPEMFDGIYAGTETRDPVITDQLLQQYESYNIIRYYETLRKDGKNGGGWVDTYSIRYVDRYAEQLWDTMLAKAPEITLFNWHPAAQDTPAEAGARPWAGQDTSFNWDRIVADWKAANPDAAVPPGWGLAAGAALKQIDAVLDQLGKPTGIPTYRPANSSSAEDFLPNYLGNVGIPIALTARFPQDAQTILLTQASAADPDILDKVKRQLEAGKAVFVTSGFVKATQDPKRKDRGFQDLVEVYATGNQVLLNDYYNGYGAGNGESLRDDPKVAPRDVLFPELHYFTNDAWPIIRGVAGARGFPVLLMNRYSKGVLYILSIPSNIGDLYSMPPGVMNSVKTYLMADTPVRIEAPAGVSLFTYENGAYVIQSFRDTPTTVKVVKHAVDGKARPAAETVPGASRDTVSEVVIPPHSFRVYKG